MRKELMGVFVLVILFFGIGLKYQNGVIDERDKKIKEIKASLDFCNETIKNTSIASTARGKIEQIDKEKKDEKVVNVGTNSYTF